MADDNLPAKSFLLLKNRQLSILQQKFFSFFPKATLKVIQLESHSFIFAGSQRNMMSEMFLSHARPFYQSTSTHEPKKTRARSKSAPEPAPVKNALED